MWTKTGMVTASYENKGLVHYSGASAGVLCRNIIFAQCSLHDHTGWREEEERRNTDFQQAKIEAQASPPIYAIVSFLIVKINEDLGWFVKSEFRVNVSTGVHACLYRLPFCAISILYYRVLPYSIIKSFLLLTAPLCAFMADNISKSWQLIAA